MPDILTPEVIEALVSLVTVVVLSIIGKTSHHFSQTAKGEYAQGVITRAEKAARDAVRHVNQTFVSNLLADSEGTTLSIEEGRNAMRRSVEECKVMIGSQGLAELGAIVGDVEPWLQSKLEAAVGMEKNVNAPQQHLLQTFKSLQPAIAQVIENVAGGQEEDPIKWTSDVECWKDLMAGATMTDSVWAGVGSSTAIMEAMPTMPPHMLGVEAVCRLSRCIGEPEKLLRLAGLDPTAPDAYPSSPVNPVPEGK